MFQKSKDENDKNFTSSATLISAGTVLQGDLQSDNDLRIDGTIHGNVSSQARVIVGPTGFVEGNIEGAQADISGRITGNIIVKEMAQLRNKCNVQGNITSVNLQVDAGAIFNGQSQMGNAGSVVHINEGQTPPHAKAK